MFLGVNFSMQDSKNVEALMQYFYPEDLPKRYGGTNPREIPELRWDLVPQYPPKHFDEEISMQFIAAIAEKRCSTGWDY